MYFKEDKVGYSHFKIEPSAGNFAIVSDSTMRLTAMKKTNEVRMKERTLVRPDLTMISFQSAVRMNDKDLHMTGRYDGNRFLVDMTVEGQTLKKEYPLDDKVYHSSAISLMPALRGLREGGTTSFAVFNVERQGVEKVEQLVSSVKGPPGPGGAVWKVKSDLGRSQVVSYLNKSGLTVFEKTLDGALITIIEDKSTAEAFMSKKGQGKDLALDISLIKVSRPIPAPEKVRLLKVKIEGIEASSIPEDQRQRVSRSGKTGEKAPFELTVKVEDLVSTGPAGNDRLPEGMDEYLASTMSIQSDNKAIVAQAKQIVAPEDSPQKKITKLASWTAKNIKKKMQDSFTALSVLKSKEGECQAHAFLYTALARSQGIPTRLVTGLVYAEGVGFLYHAWAESYAGGWIAVDPTMNQTPADATHIKLFAGESAKDTSSLLKTVGNVKMEVNDFK